MKGFNVLFPMAFHYTGTPVLAMAKRVTSGDRKLIEDFINIYQVPKDIIGDFTQPIKIAEYFHNEIKKGMEEIGYSIDWRREFTTIEPQYNKFIEWQFKKLRNEGLITRGSHPVGWCPSCESPMGQHDTKGDVEPDISEITLVKFKLVGKEIYLPTGTLRAETLFGVTNLWIRPEVNYVHASVNDEDWIISQECAEKLDLLDYNVMIKKEISGESLVGEFVENPLTSSKVIILPASFVDPKNATGIVMSVPGHAPYDYIALEDLKKKPETLLDFKIQPAIISEIQPISLISLEGYSKFPALDVIKRIGAVDQLDTKIEEATQIVYSQEFHRGKMKENTGQYAELPVSTAREKVEKNLLEKGQATKMYELKNSPVNCRCGTEVLVKIFEDQWFIDYGNAEWKQRVYECLRQMKIIPSELIIEFNNVVEWLKEKACARKHGLGTRLPWDHEWIIESLSDSVIYMSYYTISKAIREYELRPEQLTDKVFDYILLGEGNPEIIENESSLTKGLIEDMREEFTYFQ